MADENEVILLKYFLEKTRANNFEDVGYLNRANVIVGETYDWRGKGIEYFPRVEFLLTHFAGLGEISNFSKSEGWLLQVGCFLYRDTNNFIDEDYYKILNFGKRMKNLIFSANGDRRLGIYPCPNFQQMSAFSEVDIEGEVFNKVSTCLIQFTVLVDEINVV